MPEERERRGRETGKGGREEHGEVEEEAREGWIDGWLAGEIREREMV